MTIMTSRIGNLAFEPGKILLKDDPSDNDSGRLIISLGKSEKEKIILQKEGIYCKVPDTSNNVLGLLVTTNYRFVFLKDTKTILTKKGFLSFPFSIVRYLELTRVSSNSSFKGIRFLIHGLTHQLIFTSDASAIINTIINFGKIPEGLCRLARCPYCLKIISYQFGEFLNLQNHDELCPFCRRPIIR
jgi:hypothetical protein